MRFLSEQFAGHMTFTERKKKRSLTDVVLSLWIMSVHKLQQTNFNLCLVQKWLFVFNDFYSDVFFLLMVIGLANLKVKKKKLII